MQFEGGWKQQSESSWSGPMCIIWPGAPWCWCAPCGYWGLYYQCPSLTRSKLGILKKPFKSKEWGCWSVRKNIRRIKKERSLTCQDGLDWSEFQMKTEEVSVVKNDLGRSESQMKTEEVSVVKKTLDGQNFKSSLKKSQLSRRPWMVRISSQDWRSLSCQETLGWL